MAMSAALGHFVSRTRHARIHEDDDEEIPVDPIRASLGSPTALASATVSGGEAAADSSTAISPAARAAARRLAAREAAEATEEAAVAQEQRSAEDRATTNNDNEEEADATNDDDDDGSTTAAAPTDARARAFLNHRRLLELEEERELSRRRTSTCVLIAVFVLFRLWVEALLEGDPGLLVLCLVGTSWTARWIRTNREREEELDRRIEEYVRNNGEGVVANGGAEGDGGGNGRGDLTLMSFQAQLALAIIESQRQMMEGGFGHPDGNNARNQERGVSDEARGRWERYEFTSSPFKAGKEGSGSGRRRSSNGLHGSGSARRKGGYGSVASSDLAADEAEGHDLQLVEEGAAGPRKDGPPLAAPDDEESAPKIVKDIDKDIDNLSAGGMPTCSICLCEYEDGETLARLPCGHIYHDECVCAWTSNHVRCPLCNFDLEEGEVSPTDLAGGAGDVGTPEDSIV